MCSRRSARWPLTSAIVVALLLFALAPAPRAALRTEVLRSVGSLPPHIVVMFEEPVNFQQAPNGVSYVLDRRGHSVYTIDPARTFARKAVDIGQEAGRIVGAKGKGQLLQEINGYI